MNPREINHQDRTYTPQEQEDLIRSSSNTKTDTKCKTKSGQPTLTKKSSETKKIRKKVSLGTRTNKNQTIYSQNNRKPFFPHKKYLEMPCHYSSLIQQTTLLTN